MPGRPGSCVPDRLTSHPGWRLLAPMRALCLALFVALAPGPARSEDLPPLAGAGVLERDGRTDCSAVLVAPDLVATAGHCVAGKKLAAEGGDSTIRFHTGSYPGHPSLARTAIRILRHPLDLTARATGARILTADLALLELDAPVPPGIALPVAWGEPAQVGERLLIASYPGGRGDRARERLCEVTEADGSLARLSCRVVPGESGAPVVRLAPDGPEMAAMVVAMSMEGRQPYALTVQARTRLLQLAAVWGLTPP